LLFFGAIKLSQKVLLKWWIFWQKNIGEKASGIIFTNILRADFCTRVFCAAFLYLLLDFVIFFQRNIAKKDACKMLAKLKRSDLVFKGFNSKKTPFICDCSCWGQCALQCQLSHDNHENWNLSLIIKKFCQKLFQLQIFFIYSKLSKVVKTWERVIK